MSRSKRTEQTRLALLEAGSELLTEQGYHGTGLKQILDAVQIPKGSFYYYFANKEQFVAEVIAWHLQQLDAEVSAIIARQGSPMARLKALYGLAIEQEAQHYSGCIIANLSAEIGAQSQLCSEVMAQGWQQWQSQLTRLIAEGQQCGEVRTDVSAEQLSRLYLDRWEGGLIRMRVEQQPEQFRQAMDVMIDVIFKA